MCWLWRAYDNQGKDSGGKDTGPALCAGARSRYEYAGDKKGDGVFWFFDKRSGSGQGRRSEAECRNAIEIRAAFDVLEAAGIEDAHAYDWHLWCDSAEHIVQEIVRRDRGMREAQADLDPIYAIARAMVRGAT